MWLNFRNRPCITTQDTWGVLTQNTRVVWCCRLGMLAKDCLLDQNDPRLRFITHNLLRTSQVLLGCSKACCTLPLHDKCAGQQQHAAGVKCQSEAWRLPLIQISVSVRLLGLRTYGTHTHGRWFARINFRCFPSPRSPMPQVRACQGNAPQNNCSSRPHK